MRGMDAPPASDGRKLLIGVLPGEGVGPEVIAAALTVLDAVATSSNLHVELRSGGAIGLDAERATGRVLTDEVCDFIAEVFADGGTILCGPGGGRFVYDLRRRINLAVKLSPIQPCPALDDCGAIHPRARQGVDLLVVRDNAGGIYQGRWSLCADNGTRVAKHEFEYDEADVKRILTAGARIARRRQGIMHIVVKRSGVPTISELWEDVAAEVAKAHGVTAIPLDFDFAAYHVIHNAAALDVIVAPNMCGDVLADVAAALLASRGMSYSGNYDDQGHAVYQTNHGAAYDLAGRDVANPCGQIHSLAMMLHETFGLTREAQRIERAMEHVWRQGLRTADLTPPGSGHNIVGTRALTDHIVQALDAKA